MVAPSPIPPRLSPHTLTLPTQPMQTKRTPLMLAAVFGDAVNVRLLLAAGANVEARDSVRSSLRRVTAA